MLHGKFIQLNIQGKNGQHYLTGMYFITKVTDSISTSGFVKTLSIIKNTTSKQAAGITVSEKLDMDTLSNLSDITTISTNVYNNLQGLVSAGLLTQEQASVIQNASKAGPKTEEQQEKEDAAFNQLNNVTGKTNDKVYEDNLNSYRDINKSGLLNGNVNITLNQNK